MKDQEMNDLYQFLAGYWYDREENDAEIVNEFVAEVSPEIAAQYTDLLKRFIQSSESLETKSRFVRKTVWRWFPPEQTSAPVEWLKEISVLLDKSQSRPII